MSAMDDSGPLDQADDMRSTPQSPPPPSLTANDMPSNMLEETRVHAVKRMWNRDDDEAVDTAKRARFSENQDSRLLNDGTTDEKLSHDTPATLVPNKDSNGDGSEDHLPQDINNGALENNTPLVNSTKESGVTKSVITGSDVTGSGVSGSGISESSITESGVTESGITESGVTESSITETRVTESGITETKVTDSGIADSGIADSGIADSGIADSGIADSGIADSGIADSGIADSGIADSGIAESGNTESVGASRDAVDISPSNKLMASQEQTNVSSIGTETSAKDSSALNTNGDESYMEIDSADISESVTNKPSGVGTDQTSQSDKDNSRNLNAGSPSELLKDAQRLTTVDSDLATCKTATGATNHGQSELNKEDTCVSSKEKLSSGQHEDDPIRTDEETSTSKTLKTDLENGDNKAETSPTGSDSNEPKEAISKEEEQVNVDHDSTNKEEDSGTTEKPSIKIEKEPTRSSSPDEDVIVLSDDEAVEMADDDDASSIDTGPFTPLPDDDPLNKLTDNEMTLRDKAIRVLQEELRTEEGKLLLLKKLRQSQLQPVQVVQKENATATTTNASGTAVVIQKVNPTPNVTTTLPQLMRTAQGTKIQMPTQQQQQQQQHLLQLKQLQQLQQQQQQQQKPGSRIIQMPQLIRGPQFQAVGRSVLTSQSGPPPLVMVSRGSTQGQAMHNAPHIIRVSSTGTISTTSGHVASSQVIHQQSRTTSSPANDTQSAASRQAAAKLALRKQLEKTLLQIPPPKPPPPELHFLPSAANNEFIILVGLEEVVNTILELDKDSKRKTAQRFTDPFRCAQCKTDFTTIWKQDAKQGIMCETCIVSNQKKSLKAEHTNRLKTAFVKALQQEQEIEQRMQQGHNPVIHSVTSKSQQPSRQLHQITALQQHQQHQLSQPIRQRVMNPVPHQQRTVLNPAPNSQRVVQPVTYTYIPPVSGMKNSGQAFTYRVPTTQIQMVSKNQISGSHHSAAARQREYLLDMIPSKVLNQNTAVPWKR